MLKKAAMIVVGGTYQIGTVESRIYLIFAGERANKERLGQLRCQRTHRTEPNLNPAQQALIPRAAAKCVLPLPGLLS